MKEPMIDSDYLHEVLLKLLNIPSPTGFTDQIVHFVGAELARFKVQFNVTRRGAIRATLPGRITNFDRAIAVHLDTLGAMVNGLKPNGRLAVSPVGTWSSRFAEGARVTVFNAQGPQRGTVLPLKASGHAHGDAVDRQPVNWDQLEVRVDSRCGCQEDLLRAGYDVGDFVTFDAVPEITSDGFINSRHLDDKAGVAILLALAQSIRETDLVLPMDCHLLFTISEEVGSGAAAVVYGDVAEMVVVDLAPVAEGQNATEFGAVLGMMDQTGPFDYHLTRKLIRLCETHGIEYRRDVFRHYRSDSASAIEAGHDTRTALVGFGVDASHCYERTHVSSLNAVAHLMGRYIRTDPTFARDKDDLASLEGFPTQPMREPIDIKT